MPRRVHILGWADRPCPSHGEENVPLVLSDNAFGVGLGPTILAGEPGREGKCAIGPVDVEVEDGLEKLGLV